jgi:hypothetical protein
MLRRGMGCCWLRGRCTRGCLEVLRAALARLGLVEEMPMLFASPDLLQRVPQRTGLSKLRRGGLELAHRQRAGGGGIFVRRLRRRRLSFAHHGGGACVAVGACAAVRCGLRRVRPGRLVALVGRGARCETYGGLMLVSSCSNKLLELPRWAADRSSAKELSSSVSSRVCVFAAACGVNMGFCGDESVLTGRNGAPGLREVLFIDCGGRGRREGEAEQSVL